MDAAWKVYVGDRRFDDNQISNLFLKLKYETVGRFTFDFRPIDGDESYMVVNNTLRIFWGDLHKLDGVIQRVDWDETQYCYHVFGADIRGFLLDRVNTEPSTVSSYTSDIQTQVQYTGCDFPSNIWTGAGDKIGTYTFHYKLGIQNTIRITGATQNMWYFYTERGTVYDHVNGCLYDATKNWTPNEWGGATLRFVSGACKNNVYNINGNSENRVCIRLPGEAATSTPSSYDDDPALTFTTNGISYGRTIADWSFEHVGALDVVTLDWNDFDSLVPGKWYGNDKSQPGYGILQEPLLTSDAYSGSVAARCRLMDFYTGGFDGQMFIQRQDWSSPWDIPENGRMYATVWAKAGLATSIGVTTNIYHSGGMVSVAGHQQTVSSSWASYNLGHSIGTTYSGVYRIDTILTTDGPFKFERFLDIDCVGVYIAGCPGPETGAGGTIPGCSRLGDIYEIVTATMTRIEPASLAPATLEKDNHIIKYNQTEELSDRTTVVTVMGAD